MIRNTSIILGDRFGAFVGGQVASGRYGSASEVIRAGLRMLEDRESKVNALRTALDEGEASGVANYSFSKLMKRLKKK